MKDNNYEFRVGDEVETVDGMSGKIVSICRCERCAERGFFEPRWETSDGKDSDYITVNQVNWGFPYYRRIGKYVWNHDADEEKSTKNIFTKENGKMKEIKLTIDGKEVQLTIEQLKALIEMKKNPFTVEEGDQYWCANSFAGVDSHFHTRHRDDKSLIDACNAFNDSSFANQVALHQLFYRKLLKFIYDNECKDTAEWNGGNPHWYITYATDIKDFVVGEDFVFKAHSIYFSSEEAAEYAIEKVIKPFIEEYPEFIW